MQAVEVRIRQYLTKHYTVPQSAIEAPHRFGQDLGLNEWEFLEVLVYIEHLFGVSLPDDILSKPLTVNQLSDLVYLLVHQ